MWKLELYSEEHQARLNLGGELNREELAVLPFDISRSLLLSQFASLIQKAYTDIYARSPFARSDHLSQRRRLLVSGELDFHLLPLPPSSLELISSSSLPSLFPFRPVLHALRLSFRSLLSHHSRGQ